MDFCEFDFQVSPSADKACQLDSCLSSSEALYLGLILPIGFAPSPVHFPLFFPAGPSHAAFLNVGERSFSAEHLDLLQQFHEIALSCLLGPHSTFALDLDSISPLDAFRFHLGSSPLPALCAILTETYDLAIDAMETAVHYKTVRCFKDLPRHLWAGSVLRARHYGSSELHQRERWLVRRVANHLSPLSVFPDPSKAPTFAAYFKHACDDPQQPLLEVVRVPTVPETALFRHPEAAPRTHRRQTVLRFLIPELCDRYPLPAQLWLLVAMLPAALCRMQQLLGAARLHKAIWPMAPADGAPTLLWNGKEAPKSSFDLTQLLAALTAIECRDFINLERLELLGDSFLKFAVSVVLFAKNKGPNVQEGDLTQWRKDFISNSTLFR